MTSMRSNRATSRLNLLALGLALGCAFSPPIQAQQPDSTALPTVNMQEAVTLALRSSPLLAQRQGAVTNALSAERVQFASYLPTLSFSSGASLQSTERFNEQTNTSVSGSSDSYSAGLSTSVDLFTAGRRGAELRQARAGTDAAEAAVVEQRFAVALAAKQAFFAVLRADEQARVVAARIERARLALDAAERRLQVGNATRSDALRARLELNQARQAELQARSDYRAATYALGATVGQDGPVAARVDQPLEPRPLALSDAELVEIVVAQSPAVTAAEANALADEAGLRAARTQYFPTLRLSGGYDWFNQDAAFDGGRTSWDSRLSLSFPVFNGFAREDAVQRASVQLGVARIQADAARRNARANLERVLTDLRLTEEQIALAQEAVDVATEDMRVVEARYGLGAATILEQLTSQNALVQAENDLIAARYDYQVARAQLEALVGRDL